MAESWYLSIDKNSNKEDKGFFRNVKHFEWEEKQAQIGGKINFDICHGEKRGNLSNLYSWRRLMYILRNPLIHK